MFEDTRNSGRTATTPAGSTATQTRAANQCGNPKCECHSAAGKVHCPAHNDKTPSLSVDERNGKVLWTCRAGCTQETVTAALKAQSGGAHKPTAKPQHETAFDYHDATGAMIYQVVRRDQADGSKKFSQRHRDNSGQWVWNLKGIEPVLYRLPDVMKAKTVFVVEGEKCADRINDELKARDLYGEYVATTNSGGGDKWRERYSQTLAVKSAIVLPDNDAPGRKHADSVTASLDGKAASLKVLWLPDLPEKGDVVNFLDAGGTLEKLLELADDAPEWKTQPESTLDSAYKFEFSTDADLDECLSEITWLWPGFIPNGFITGIVAEQDQGKSMVTQKLCDIILRGAQWPNGVSHTPQADTKLLWIDTEGSIALFHQRAKAWKMPRGRFILPLDPLRELTIDDAESWQWIEAATEKFHPPAVVVDALSGAHRHGKENGNDEMKPIMKKLAALAQQHNIAVVVIHHLNKPAPGVAAFPITIHRLRGASAIPQYCRSIIALGTPDPSKPESRRLDVIKLNLARKPEPVGYELTDEGPEWGVAPEPPKQRRAVDDAIDFLQIVLQPGRRPVLEIEDEAKAHKIGGNALKDAKKALNVKAQRERVKNGRWFWYLPESVTVPDGIEEGVI